MKSFTLLLLLLVLTSTAAYGQSTDFDNSNPQLDAYYQRGSFLVYDCIRDHWVCTQKLEHKRCQKYRKEDLKDFKPRLSCAYFDEYKTRELCQKQQQILTNQFRGDRFCLHPQEALRKRDF